MDFFFVFKKDLKQAFKKYGKIENIRFRSVAVAKPTTPKKVCFIKREFNDNLDDIHAYIVYETKEEAKNALDMNSKIFMERHLRVDIAAFQKKKLTNSCSIFLGNLPYDIDDESIWEHFKDCGTISAVRVVRDSQYRIGKGFGYVMFDNPLAVKNALKLDQAKLKGRKIRISKAIRKQKQKPGQPIVKKQKAVPVKAKKDKRTERSKNFQGKKAVEGKTPRLQLPDWKVEKKNVKQKQKQKKQKQKQKKKNSNKK